MPHFPPYTFSANTSDFVIVQASLKKPEKFPAVGLDDNGYYCNKQLQQLELRKKRRQIQDEKGGIQGDFCPLERRAAPTVIPLSQLR